MPILNKVTRNTRKLTDARRKKLKEEQRKRRINKLLKDSQKEFKESKV